MIPNNADTSCLSCLLLYSLKQLKYPKSKNHFNNPIDFLAFPDQRKPERSEFDSRPGDRQQDRQSPPGLEKLHFLELNKKITIMFLLE